MQQFQGTRRGRGKVVSKQAILQVSPYLLAEICTVDWRIPRNDLESIICIEGLPVGAKYIRCFYDSERDMLCMVFEHKSFAEVEQGNPFPMIIVSWHMETKTS
jgi:hypothetical protein